MDSFAAEQPLEEPVPSPGPGQSSGPSPLVLSATYVRDLDEGDIVRLAMPQAPALSPKPTLKDLRFSHHQLARLIAIGEAPVRISLITGYSPGYISSIQSDPTFAALVEHYSGVKDEIMVDVRTRMRDLGLDTLLLLQRRLHEEGANPGSQKFSHRELMEAIKLLLVEPTSSGPGGPSGTAPVNVQISFVKASTPEAGNVIEGELAASSPVSASPFAPGPKV